MPLRRRSPWLNGKIERWHQTMTRELIRRLPHWTDGPKREDGTLDVPADVAPLPIEVFIALLLEWVAAYNFEREHTALGGRTPAQAWEEDRTPLRAASEHDLRRYLLERPGTRVIEARGVKFENRWYTDEKLVDSSGAGLSCDALPTTRAGLRSISTGNGSAVRSAKTRPPAPNASVCSMLARRPRERRRASHGGQRTALACAGRR